MLQQIVHSFMTKMLTRNIKKHLYDRFPNCTCKRSNQCTCSKILGWKLYLFHPPYGLKDIPKPQYGFPVVSRLSHYSHTIERESIIAHFIHFYAIRELCEETSQPKHGKKSTNLSLHGMVLVGDMLGPMVQMSIVTLQVAQSHASLECELVRMLLCTSFLWASTLASTNDFFQNLRLLLVFLLRPKKKLLQG
jgi:hypothetical protein